MSPFALELGVAALALGVFALGLQARGEDRRWVGGVCAAGLLGLTALAFAAAPVGPAPGGRFVQDGLALFAKRLFLIATLIGVVGGLRTPGAVFARRAVEYHLLVLASLLGMLVLASARDLVLLFVAFELMSIPLYVLAGFAKRIADRAGQLRHLLFAADAGFAQAVETLRELFELLFGLTSCRPDLVGDIARRIGDDRQIVAQPVHVAKRGFAGRPDAVDLRAEQHFRVIVHRAHCQCADAGFVCSGSQGRIGAEVGAPDTESFRVQVGLLGQCGNHAQQLSRFGKTQSRAAGAVAMAGEVEQEHIEAILLQTGGQREQVGPAGLVAVRQHDGRRAAATGKQPAIPRGAVRRQIFDPGRVTQQRFWRNPDGRGFGSEGTIEQIGGNREQRQGTERQQRQHRGQQFAARTAALRELQRSCHPQPPDASDVRAAS